MIAIVTVLLMATACTRVDAGSPEAGPAQALTWEEKLVQLRWVAYSPPSADPERGVEASEEAIREDIAVLVRAGFTGLVTYGSAGTLGRYVPQLAQAAGIKGLIIGIWDPTSTEELAQAEAAASLPVVVGLCVGNEGIPGRYSITTLSATIERLQRSTGKPVATAEELGDYSDPALFALGDWLFPNAHPYFSNKLEPAAAVGWTEAAYDDLVRRADKRPVLLKEVGLPTEGDPEHELSEAAQQQYYEALAKTHVRFVYFEAFDQPWKQHLSVEPHWGIFRADRSPKLLGAQLLKTAPTHPVSQELYVYRDAGAADNHFTPTGYMGDAGDVEVTPANDVAPHSGTTAIRVSYTARGQSPNHCTGGRSCQWAGVYWQEPPNNWGKDEIWAGRGLDLSRFDLLSFWARADKQAKVEFKVGGIHEPYGDSLKSPRSVIAQLATEWRRYEIDLKDADLMHIIGGFCWVSHSLINPDGVVFYLDDIRYEKR